MSSGGPARKTRSKPPAPRTTAPNAKPVPQPDAGNLSSYEVGYGKPPTQNQFKKGRSGNPKGRPKGSRNMSTILEAALTERVAVSKNGKLQKMRLIDAIAISLATKGASGNLPAIRELLNAIGKFGVFAEEENDNKRLDEKLTQEEQDVLDQIMQSFPVPEKKQKNNKGDV